MDDPKRWVDFKLIKQLAPLEAVLAHYGVKLKRYGNTLRGRCPLPTHSSKESSVSFMTANKGVGVWSCHSDSCVAARDGRKGGNALDFVAIMERCSIREAAQKLQDWFAVHPEPPGQKPAAPAPAKAELVSKEKERARAGESEQANKPLAFRLKGVDACHPYLMERGVSRETAEHFGVGFFPGKGSMAGRLVIPIENEAGELVAYAGRSMDNTEPKYKFPAGFRKSLVLWNLNRARGTAGTCVVVVEGFFDCMKVHQAGFPCCVALMGSSLTTEQEELVVGLFSQVVLMLDGDEAGEKGSADAAGRLVHRVFVRVVDLAEGKQPDELSSADIQKLLA